MGNILLRFGIASIMAVAIFASCAETKTGVEKPVMKVQVSEVCDTKNIGKQVEVSGYLGIEGFVQRGDKMKCTTQNEKCLFRLRSHFKDEKFASIIIRNNPLKPDAIENTTLNIEELGIRDFNGKLVAPKSKMILVGTVKGPPPGLDESVPDRCVVDVTRIEADTQAETDPRYCSGRQAHDEKTAKQIGDIFEQRKNVGKFVLSNVDWVRENPKQAKRFCKSLAEAIAAYSDGDKTILHVIALYESSEIAQNGFKEHIANQEKGLNAKIISDVKMNVDSKTIDATFKQPKTFYQSMCSWKDDSKVICHEIFASDESDVRTYSKNWFKEK